MLEMLDKSVYLSTILCLLVLLIEIGWQTQVLGGEEPARTWQGADPHLAGSHYLIIPPSLVSKLDAFV